jgi:hypothetical protein
VLSALDVSALLHRRRDRRHDPICRIKTTISICRDVREISTYSDHRSRRLMFDVRVTEETIDRSDRSTRSMRAMISV